MTVNMMLLWTTATTMAMGRAWWASAAAQTPGMAQDASLVRVKQCTQTPVGVATQIVSAWLHGTICSWRVVHPSVARHSMVHTLHADRWQDDVCGLPQ